MARIRTIKPEFAHSESMGRVSREARLLFILLWTFVDDSGKARGHSRMLASALFPYDEDAPSLIDGWVSELEAEGCVLRYEVDGASYIMVPKWLSHQRIDKPTPSRLPSPREFSGSPRELPGSLPSTVDLVPSTYREGAPSQPAEENRSGSRSRWQPGERVPDRWHIVTAGELKRLGYEDADLNAIAAKFEAHYGASGDAKTRTEWQACFTKWAINEGRKPNGTNQRQPRDAGRKFASDIFLEAGNTTRAAE